MKIRHFFILILSILSFVSCSTDDELAEIFPASISFVHLDGSPVVPNECINPDSKYAVKVVTKSNGVSKFQTLRLDYAVNGTTYTMTFSNSGEQIIPVSLIEGTNFVQIVGSKYTNSLVYNSQGNFELVE